MIAMVLAMQLAAGGTNQKAALTCGKYQHVQHHPQYCHGAPCNETTGTCIAIAICEDAKPDTCEEDVRMTTEREWQELLQRIKKLEDQSSGVHLDDK